MDDPWAAPSWSTPAKSSSSSSPPEDFSFGSAPASSSTRFDVSDPWGPPASAAPAAGGLPTFFPPTKPTRDDGDTPDRQASLGTPGWGSEPSWSAEGEIPAPKPPDGFSESPGRHREPDDMPSWGATSLSRPASPSIRQSFEGETPSSPKLPSTPPKPFSALPDFASPRSPLSHHSPGSYRSATPTAPQMAYDEDPEQAFVAALPKTTTDDMPRFEMPKSPSFGEGDFGGFSTGLGDPWGGKAGWGGEDVPREANQEYEASETPKDSQEADEGEGWGGVQAVRIDRQEVKSAVEEDWQVAQRRIQLQEQLTPRDKVDRLRTGWQEVAGTIIGLRKIPDASREEVQKLEAALRKLETDRDEILASLATIPSGVNTYPPVLSSFSTHTTYLTSLTRPNPAPGTSLLVASTKRPRRAGTLDESSSTPWLSRSRLGEPEAPPVEAAPQEEAKSRWAFWGKRPPIERQLTTSGGGVLEVKSASSTGTALNTAPPVSAELLKSASERSPSMASARPSLGQSPGTSRPASILDAPVDPSTPSAGAGIASPIAAPSVPVPATVGGPSAMSRFFGRLRRNPSSSGPVGDAEAHDPKDLELGEDDFSFLNQVPSLAPPDRSKGDDLLGIESGRSEDIAGLESMLSSKPTPLPAPLAPPPKHSAPVYSRSNSAVTGRQVSQQQKTSDMDLLSDLYDGDMSSVSTPPVAANGNKDPMGWDDFLAPASSGPNRTSQAAIFPPVPATQQSPPPIPHRTSSFGDFDDFGTPQKGTSSSATFDDFGDFSAFEDTPSAPAISSPSKTSLTPTSTLAKPFISPTPSVQQARIPFSMTPSIQTHKPRQSLDHTPTLNLLSDASASRGKRWPAPPSPDVPSLSPPPISSAPSQPLATGFPFLSPPPPPPRPASGLRKPMDLFGADEEVLHSPVATGRAAPNQLMSPVSTLATPPASRFPSVPSVPSRTAGPLALPTANGTTANTASPGLSQGKGGLSAQDLSFFDSL